MVRRDGESLNRAGFSVYRSSFFANEKKGGCHECASCSHRNFRRKSKIASDGGTRRSKAFKNIPGQSAALIWSTTARRRCRSTALT